MLQVESSVVSVRTAGPARLRQNLKGRFLAMAVMLVSLAGLAVVNAAPASAGTMWMNPDPWIYCSRTVPNPAPMAVDVSYAGIYANPYYFSQNTSCRDLYNYGNGKYSYGARTINWTQACRWAYNNGGATGYGYNGRWWCYLP